MSLAVGGSTVELYWMDTGVLEDAAHFACAYRSLSRGRQRKADAFLFMKDKKLSLGAGLLLRPFRRDGSRRVCGHCGRM